MKNLNNIISESIKSSIYKILNEGTESNQDIENFFQQYVESLEEQLEGIERFKQFFLESVNVISNFLSNNGYLQNIDAHIYNNHNLIVTFYTNHQPIENSDEFYDTGDSLLKILEKEVENLDLKKFAGRFFRRVEIKYNMENDQFFFELSTEMRKEDVPYYY